jgi:Mg-chelatase subunit ChlD
MGKKVAGLLLVDHSGSMMSCQKSATKAVNDFFTERANAATAKEEWALCEFDTTYREVFGFTDAAAVKVYNLKPGGMTALHDSIATSVVKLAAHKPDKGKLRILVIVTDGYENASQEHTAASVKKMIEAKKAEGWQIIYLGANQDAVMEAAEFGIAGESSMTYDTASSGAAMASVGALVTRNISGQGGGFTDEERRSAIQPQKMTDIINHGNTTHV